jgi:hypothetical protein
VLATWVVEYLPGLSVSTLCNVAITFASDWGEESQALLGRLVDPFLMSSHLHEIPTKGLQNVLWAYNGKSIPAAAGILQRVNHIMDTRCIDLTSDNPKPFRPGMNSLTPLACVPLSLPSTIPHWSWMAR